MQYYSINNSLNSKILGHYPQTKSIKYNCDVWDEPRFIEHVHFQKIDFEPIVANAILFPKSNLTDLISVTGMGFTRKLLMSGKLKSIIERHRKTGLQFYKSKVIHKIDVIDDYWVLNVYEVQMDAVDYVKSEIISRRKKEEGGTYLNKEDISNIDEFIRLQIELEKNRKGQLFIDKIVLKDSFQEDFFTLLHVEGGVKYVVSEKLKQEIEDAGCTGIEFQPVELSLNEWLHGGERERIYGKA